MIGAVTVLNPSLGLLLALGQVPADVPEGFAAVATRAGIAGRTRVLMALSFTAPILIGAALGYIALREALEVLPLSVLALTRRSADQRRCGGDGHRSHEGETSDLGPIALTAGFTLIALLSGYLGS